MTTDAESATPAVYVITARRFGEREAHSYVVGASTTEAGAREMAAIEEQDRAGKYVCEIVLCICDIRAETEDRCIPEPEIVVGTQTDEERADGSRARALDYVRPTERTLGDIFAEANREVHRLRAQVTELQTDYTRLETEAREARASFEHWKQEAGLERAALRVGALDVAALRERAEKAEAKLVALAKAVRTEQLAHRAQVEASCIHAFYVAPDCAQCKREEPSYADHKAAGDALDALVAAALGEGAP